MTTPNVDTIHYVRLPKAMGARAEMVRMTYVLAGKPYADHLVAFSEAAQTVASKNPFKQFPFIVTPSGQSIYQSIAIMHHVGHGTSAWPSDPAQLTQALMVAQGAYDLYQAFGGFTADDAVGRAKFEEKRAPQFFGALGEIYATRKYAAGEIPTFADCISHQAVAWCVRRNEVAAGLLAKNDSLRGFMTRFEAVPAIRAFMEKQAAARLVDDSL
jgi:glutathione S-transferase